MRHLPSGPGRRTPSTAPNVWQQKSISASTSRQTSLGLIAEAPSGTPLYSVVMRPSRRHDDALRTDSRMPSLLRAEVRSADDRQGSSILTPIPTPTALSGRRNRAPSLRRTAARRQDGTRHPSHTIRWPYQSPRGRSDGPGRQLRIMRCRTPRARDCVNPGAPTTGAEWGALRCRYILRDHTLSTQLYFTECANSG